MAFLSRFIENGGIPAATPPPAFTPRRHDSQSVMAFCMSALSLSMPSVGLRSRVGSNRQAAAAPVSLGMGGMNTAGVSLKSEGEPTRRRPVSPPRVPLSGGAIGRCSVYMCMWRGRGEHSPRWGTVDRGARARCGTWHPDWGFGF